MRKNPTYGCLILGIALAFEGPTVGAPAAPLAVCATTPDLASLVREVAGDQVALTVFAKGPQDPHYVEAKPSFIRALHEADVFVQVGLELEVGWAPVLLRAARNSRIQPGSKGFVDASEVIRALEIPPASADRSTGDIHPRGNPHYLLDPLCGLKVARLIRDRLGALRPEKREYFEERYASFSRRLIVALLGEKLLEKYEPAEIPKLALLLERGGPRRFLAFLESQGQKELLGGWLGKLVRHAGARVVADHDLWSYFARRFGFSVIAFLEPRPGISPTTGHLTRIVKKMRAENVQVVLSSPYFGPRHARFVARHAEARVVSMAHQTGGRKEAGSYLKMIDHNVRQLATALESAK